MSEGLLDALWRASLQGALILAVVGILVRVFSRRLTANAQCWLWRIAYFKLLFSFVTSGFLLIQLLSPTVISEQASHHELTSMTLLADARTLVSYSPDASIYHVIDPLYAASDWLSWQNLAAVLYLFGVGLCLSRVLMSLRDTRKTLRTLEVIETGPERTAANSLAFNLGLERVPELARSVNVSSPVLISGTIVLPAGVEYDEDRLLMLLAHEMAHVQRRDLAWEWLGTAVQALFFFNPLVLLARREERLAREAAADSLAVQATLASAHYYGVMLLDIALNKPLPKPALAGGVGVIEGGSPLRRRLLALRDNRTSANTPKRVPWVVSVVTCLAVVPWWLAPSGISAQPGAPGSEMISSMAPGADEAHKPAGPAVGFRVEFYYQAPTSRGGQGATATDQYADGLSADTHSIVFDGSTTNAPIVQRAYQTLMMLKGRPASSNQAGLRKRLVASKSHPDAPSRRTA